MIRTKTRQEALEAPYLFQKDISRILGIPERQARVIFAMAKKIDREMGVVEISPRKVRRAAVEKASGIRFDQLLKAEKEKGAEKGRPE